MNKPMLVSVAISVSIIGWAFLVTSPTSVTDNTDLAQSAVSIVDGKQIIDIAAKGGYSPRKVIAKAGVPTILRMSTNGTFDCSASLVIPKLSYQKFLQPSGTEDIAIAPEQAQGTLQGLCAMGMYNFQVIFE